MSENTKVIDENTELPRFDVALKGDYYEGMRLMGEWRAKLKQRADVRSALAAGEPVSDTDARVELELAVEIEKLGVAGMGQLLAHLHTFARQGEITIDILMDELHTRFAPEIDEMLRRHDLAQTQAALRQMAEQGEQAQAEEKVA